MLVADAALFEDLGSSAVYNRVLDRIVQFGQERIDAHRPCRITVDVVETTSETLFERAEDIHIQGLKHAGASGRDVDQLHALLLRGLEDRGMEMRSSSVEAYNDLVLWPQLPSKEAENTNDLP